MNVLLKIERKSVLKGVYVDIVGKFFLLKELILENIVQRNVFIKLIKERK